MPLFAYTAKNAAGENIKSTIFADTIETAKQELYKKKITVEKIKPANKKVPFWKKSFGTVSFKEKLIFLKYLSTILKAGLTVKRALELLKTQMKNKYFAKIIGEIYESIENGQAFHDSLRKYPKVFDEIFVNLIGVGEASGRLPETIEYLEDILMKDYNFRKKIRNAMIYPVVILILIVAVSIGLIRFIVPKITEIFETFKVELPITTRILIKAEDLLNAYWWLLIIGTGALIAAGYFLMKIRSSRKFIHAVLLKVPMIGTLTKQVQITRLTRITAALLISGLTLVESLRINANILKNLIYRDYIKMADAYLHSGGEFSSYLELRSDLFPALETQMIKLGENTGTLANTLNVLADLNEEDVNEKIKTISGLIGPLMLIVMAALVGGIAISIITPIYQLPNLIQSR